MSYGRKIYKLIAVMLFVLCFLGGIHPRNAMATHSNHVLFENPNSDEPGNGPACSLFFHKLEEKWPEFDHRIHWLHGEILDKITSLIPAAHESMFIFRIGEGKATWPDLLDFALSQGKYEGKLTALFGEKTLEATGVWITIWMMASDFNDAQFADFKENMVSDIMREYPNIDPGTADVYADEMISYFRYGQYKGMAEALARILDFVFGQQYQCMLNVQHRPNPPRGGGRPGDLGGSEGLANWEKAGPECEGAARAVTIFIPHGLYGPFDVATIFTDYCEVLDHLPGDNPVGDDGVCDHIQCDGDAPKEDDPDDGDDEENPIDRDGDGIPDPWEPSPGGPGRPPKGWEPHDGICETNLIQPGGKPPWVHCGGGGGAGQGTNIPQYF